jgi:superfamily II DNA or RNA helicase/HKD family nuclease
MPKTGLYDNLINKALDLEISKAEQKHLKVITAPLDEGDSYLYFARYLSGVLAQVLSSLPEKDRVEKQLEIANDIIQLVLKKAPRTLHPLDAQVIRKDLLLGILERDLERPDSPLSTHCLITGSRHEPSFVSQLVKEIASADKVDILCSFVKWSGVRVLQEQLEALASAGRLLRTVTTCYMGATDLKAVEFLRGLPQSQVKVSYDTRRTRLHAKAYIFHRNTGLGSAYIGSSNLSRAALIEGLEWNVKISQSESPSLWSKICGTFETHWNDSEFELYTVSSHERLAKALELERKPIDGDDFTAPFLDLAPYPFQQEILDRLQSERELHNRYRNLVVAATGTGKTLIAAFDYRRFRQQTDQASLGRRVRLLFIAHREEILKQSLARFRAVLRDYNFGELYVGGNAPVGHDHLFASIQTFNSRELSERFAPDHFDYVVIDEFHHAAAPTYRELLQWVRPKVLLGLTATPERADGEDIVRFFDSHIAAEVRLPDAVDRGLLCTFQYFAITDPIDYSALRWQRGAYVAEDLDKLLTGNDMRAQLIIDKLRSIVLDIKLVRGLGFCTSIEHAKYMAKVFCRCGIPAISLTADSERQERDTAYRRLVEREVNFIFTVDLFNEGVDIPEVDTILMLRPTESLTVFLQQMGRGLRLTPEKDCLTVLDFVGHAHKSFRYDRQFRALMRPGSGPISEEVARGFAHLPSGCVIHMEPVAKAYILENIRQAIHSTRLQLVQRIREFETESDLRLTLDVFTSYHHLELDQIYKHASWERLLVLADKRDDFYDPDEERLTKGMRRIASISAPKCIAALIHLTEMGSDDGTIGQLTEEESRFLTMLHYIMWGKQWPEKMLTDSLMRLRKNEVIFEEMKKLLALRRDITDQLPIATDLPPNCTLELHARYSRDEILCAFGLSTVSHAMPFREGVLHVPELDSDIFFVTLNKTERDYSPTTMYEDYAISEDLFHWQSQSTTSELSNTGQRYINHGSQGGSIFLFVREQKRRNGATEPYIFLGPMEYVGHEGSKPMSITWRLRHPLPARLLPTIRQLAVS